MFDNNAYTRRLLSLGLAVITVKVWKPLSEFDGKPTADEVLDVAKDFDNFIRNGK